MKDIKGKNIMRKYLAIIVMLAMIFSMIPATIYAGEASNLEWWNFRNNAENNGVTDRPTPTDDVTASLKWAGKFGTGWAAAPTPPLILDDHIYIGMGSQIVKLDKETGKEVGRSDTMAANVGYAMNPILYADGKLFVQVGNGIIQAVDYETLKCVWQTEKIGGQTVSPISYSKDSNGDGYIVTGTWSGESRNGSYICVTTDDSDVLKDANGKNIKKARWAFTPMGTASADENIVKVDEILVNDEGMTGKNRGFYWAGAYADTNFIAVGSDDGTSEGDYTANAVFYTLDPITGEVIDRIDGIKGDIRSTAVYDNGYLYFNTKGGQLHMVEVDSSGNLGEDSYIDLGGMTTASPVIYNNKAYLGVCGPGGQFDPDGGHFFAVVDCSGGYLDEESKLYDIPIKGYPQAAALLSTAYENEDFDGDGEADGRVYIYFTYNANPGGIYYTYDTLEGREAVPDSSKELFIPEKSLQQYCISTICAAEDGTLYYKNDSCYLMAVETNPAYIEDIEIKDNNGNAVKWDAEFSNKTQKYSVKAATEAEYVNIELTLPDGNTVAYINDKPYKGTAKVDFDSEGKAVIKVKATKEGMHKEYTIEVERQSDKAVLSALKVGSSNGYSSFVTVSPAFDEAISEYTADISYPASNATKSFMNLWPDVGNNGTIKVYAVDNVSRANEDGTISVTSTISGHNRYAIYRTEPAEASKVRIEVTSENGNKKTNYYVTMNPVAVESVTLNESVRSMETGDKTQLVATVTPNNAAQKSVTWESDDETVATVDKNGNVTAVGPGSAQITVKSHSNVSKTDTCSITVTRKNVSKLSISDIKAQTYTGEAINPELEVKDGEKLLAENTDYTVDIENNVNPGTATVTITGKGGYDGELIKKFDIADKSVTDVALNYDKYRLETGESIKLTETITPSTVYDKSVAWSSSDEKVASVDNSGNVIAMGLGTAEITVTTTNGKKSAICKIYVQKDISGFTATISDQSYTGKELKPWVTVKDGDITLKKDTDYTVDFKNNINPGAATVIITGKGRYKGKLDKNFIITDNEVAAIIINHNTYNMEMDGSLCLTASLTPSAVYDKGVTWKSSNKSVADVDSNGRVTAVGIGTAIITVTADNGGKTAECEVRIGPKVIEGNNGIFNISEDNQEGYKIVVDYDYAKFRTLVINGKVVNPSMYTVEEGSTVITVNEEFMKSLSLGEAFVEIEFTDCTAIASIDIVSDNISDGSSESEGSDNPKTGDNSSLAVWVIGLILAAGTSGLIVRKKGK